MGLIATVKERYAENMLVRYDGDPAVNHFCPGDFEGLCYEEYSFLSGKNRLSARFYYYPCPRKDSLVVFDHGLGHGHTAYLREIEMLARRGYLVFAYDHTGCMASEGKSVGGFSRSPADLFAAISALKQEEALGGRKILAVGHSWGGFAVLNVGARHPDVTAAVAISGFRSAKAMMEQSLPFLLRPLKRHVLRIEEENNGDCARLDAVKSLKTGGVPTLVIHGDSDPVVHYKKHFLPILRAQLPNVTCRTATGRGHSPHYAEDAERYMREFFRERTARAEEIAKAGGEAFSSQYDFWRMTRQDRELWAEIFSFLEEKAKPKETEAGLS